MEIEEVKKVGQGHLQLTRVVPMKKTFNKGELPMKKKIRFEGG